MHNVAAHRKYTRGETRSISLDGSERSQSVMPLHRRMQRLTTCFGIVNMCDILDKDGGAIGCQNGEMMLTLAISVVTD